jgi:LysM repeat protein
MVFTVPMFRSPIGRSFGVVAVLAASLVVVVPSSIGAAECASYYTVEVGDSWSRISRNVGIYIRQLAAANGLTRDDAVHPGMSLCVPPKNSDNSPQPGGGSSSPSGGGSPQSASGGSSGAPASPSAPSSPAVPSGGQRLPASCPGDAQSVGRGDSWSAIASRANVSMRSLVDANRATAETPLYPGDRVCLPSRQSLPPAPTQSPPRPRPAPELVANGCAAVLQNHRRVLCMDLSARTVMIGGRNGLVSQFSAVAGYGGNECDTTVPGTFTIAAKYEFSPRKRLKWGMAYGGGCVGDQIVHAVGPATMSSARGTDGCIGMLEAAAKSAYDTMQIGDKVVVVD